MKEAKTECSGCGSRMQYDWEKGILFCEYCGNVLPVFHDQYQSERERLLVKGTNLKKLDHRETGDKIWDRLINEFEDDYEVLWLAILYMTYDLSEKEIDLFMTRFHYDLKQADKMMEDIRILAPPEISEKWLQQYRKYKTVFEEYVAKKEEEFQRKEKEKKEEETRKAASENKQINQSSSSEKKSTNHVAPKVSAKSKFFKGLIHLCKGYTVTVCVALYILVFSIGDKTIFTWSWGIWFFTIFIIGACALLEKGIRCFIKFLFYVIKEIMR